MTTLREAAQQHGVTLPDTYIPTMDDAVEAVDNVLMNEQAALLRECRRALDDLLAALKALVEDQRDASLPVLAQAREAIEKAEGGNDDS